MYLVNKFQAYIPFAFAEKRFRISGKARSVHTGQFKKPPHDAATSWIGHKPFDIIGLLALGNTVELFLFARRFLVCLNIRWIEIAHGDKNTRNVSGYGHRVTG